MRLSWSRGSASHRWSPKRLSVVGALILASACNSKAPARSTTAAPVAPITPPQITKAIFEPVYRAAKTIQGSTGTGVSYVKFAELLQGLSTEIGIAKDQQQNESDKQLHALYVEALSHYQVSAQLWQLKLSAGDALWKGEIPFFFGGQDEVSQKIGLAATAYAIPVHDRVVPGTGKKYKALPGDAVERVWATASGKVDEATELYYGRTKPTVAK